MILSGLGLRDKSYDFEKFLEKQKQNKTDGLPHILIVSVIKKRMVRIVLQPIGGLHFIISHHKVSVIKKRML